MKSPRAVSAVLTVVAVAICLSGNASAAADDIVNSQGFELPFTTVFLGTGQLEGQVNPAGEGQVIPPGQWLLKQGSRASTAVVQSSVFAPGGGIQAVRVDRAVNDNTAWGVPVNHLGYPQFPTALPPESPQPLISITWDMLVDQTLGTAGTSLFVGIQAFDTVLSETGVLAALGVDAVTGAVVHGAAGTGALIQAGVLVGFGEWNHFQILLDYSADQYTIFHNFVELGTFAFVTPGLDEFSQADIVALAPVNDAASQALTGRAYFDNFLVREGPSQVPEPSAGILLACAFGIALCVSRSSRWRHRVRR